LVFYIQEHKRLPDGSQSIRGSGTHKGRPLGLEIVLGPSWKAGSLGKDIPLATYRGIVTYRSIGAEGDAFVRCLTSFTARKSVRRRWPERHSLLEFRWRATRVT